MNDSYSGWNFKLLHELFQITNVIFFSHSGRKYVKKDNEPPLRLLDDLFRKTKTTPCIYWLPLTPEQVHIEIFTLNI